MREKVANSLDRLKQERAAGRRVLLALPAANATEIPPTLASEMSALGIEVVALTHVQALFEILAMQLPDGPGRSPLPSRAAARPAPRVARASNHRLIAGAAAAAILLGIAATVAAVVNHKGDTAVAVSPPAPTTQLASSPPPPAPQRVTLDPETVPFITSQDKARVRSEYMTAPDYKALATSLLRIAFVSGQPSQDAADRAAMDACEKVNFGTQVKLDAVCDLYASGDIVVTRRNRPPLPPAPWVAHDPSVERPFVAAQIPIANPSSRDQANKAYAGATRPKALVISPGGNWWSSSAQGSTEDAMRRSLERCGYSSADACMVIAVDDTFVVPIPTLAKAVGFYRPDALFAVQPDARHEVARRLAGATVGWNAVAVGTDGQVGIAVGAGAEQSALDDALTDCAKRDRGCRVAVLGPFLVEPVITPKGETAITPPPKATASPPAPASPQAAGSPQATVSPQATASPQATIPTPAPAPKRAALGPDIAPACSLYKVNVSLLNVSKDAGGDGYIDVLDDGEIACVTRQQKVGAEDWAYVAAKVEKSGKRIAVDGWSILRDLTALSPAEAAAYGGGSASPPASPAIAPPPPMIAQAGGAPPVMTPPAITPPVSAPPVLAPPPAAPPLVPAVPPAPSAAPPAAVQGVTAMRADEILRFDTPIPFGPYPVNGHSIEEIITTFTPLFPPIEDLPDEMWKGKNCSTCHKWDKARLCEQGATYVKSPRYALRIQHPFGGALKVALMRWVKSGCL